MDLLELVRRTAARRGGDARLADDVRSRDGEWATTEKALSGEIGTSARRAERLVAAFERLARLSGEPEPMGRAARLRSSWLVFVGRSDESVPHYLEAIRRLTGAARDGARLGLATAETRRGAFARARRLCRQVRRDARRRRDRLLTAAADLNEAGALHESGDPAAAVPLYLRARRGFAAAGHALLEANAIQNLANALVLLDRWEEAEPLLEEASARLEKLGLTDRAARCRYNQGALLVAFERLGEADEMLRQVEETFRSSGDALHGSLARLDRGEALLRAGLVPEAVHALSTARRGLARGAPPIEQARATLLLARAELARGDGAGARRLLRRPTGAALASVDAERREVLGRAAAIDGRAAAAVAMLDAAAEAYGSTRPAGRARSLVAAAACALETGDVAGARRRGGVAARIATRLRAPALEFGAAAVLFLVEDRARRRAAADRHLETAMHALERVRLGLGPDALRAALFRGRDAWFARAVRHVLEGPRGEARALALVERRRARALVDLLGASDLVGPRDERVAALRARVAVLERQAEGEMASAFLRAPETQRAPAGDPSVLRRLAVAERRLEEALRRGPAAPFSRAPDLGRLRRSLPDGTLVLALHADDEGSLAFAVDARQVRVVRGLARRSEIAALVEELHYVLGKLTLGGGFAERHAGRIAAETDALLAQLAERTLAPVADAIRSARRLVIVPHGPWHHVPFAALPFDGRPLVDTVPIVLTPALAALVAPLPEAAGRDVVLAAADEAAPTIAEEARQVAEALTGAALLVGADARSDALRGAPAPRCLHVASHGRYRPDAPALSGVRLADGWLRAADFPHLRLPGSLVVLSGCQTGVSRVDPGDEVHGLVRGVLASGAAELLACLWRIEDRATAKFMARLHALRAGGVSTEEALAQAQREAAAAGLSPWYWAGFTLWTRRLTPLLSHRETAVTAG